MGRGKQFTLVLPTMLGGRPGSSHRLSPLQPHGHPSKQPGLLRLATEYED